MTSQIFTVISTGDRTVKAHKRKKAAKEPEKIEVRDNAAALFGKILAKDCSE